MTSANSYDARYLEYVWGRGTCKRHFQHVTSATKKDSYFWNELIDRYHYLGYSPLPGAQISYLIKSPAGCLGAIGFSAAAWKVEARDMFIDWYDAQRKKALFLIFRYPLKTLCYNSK